MKGEGEEQSRYIQILGLEFHLISYLEARSCAFFSNRMVQEK